MQGLPIDLFAVGLAIFPATKQNTDPLESQSPQDRVARLAFASLLVVIRFGPSRIRKRVHRPFMKGLPEKLGTGPAPMHPVLLSATGQHRRNPAIGLQFTGAAIAVALRAERGNQSRC